MAKRKSTIPERVRKPVERYQVLHMVLKERDVEQLYALMAETGLSLADLVVMWLRQDIALRTTPPAGFKEERPVPPPTGKELV